MAGNIAAETPVPLSRGTVLVVDDEPFVRSYVQRTLRAAGYEVLAVPDGRTALQCLAERSFDLVLSDVSMPEMSGVELLRAIRATDPDVPVMLISGRPDVESAIRAVEYGALRYLVKPIGDTQLHEAVAYGLQISRLARHKREALQLLERTGSLPADRANREAVYEEATGSLTLAFQPILSTETRATFAHEALMRSSAPKATPLTILEGAERLGRIPELGRQIRALAARTLTDHPGERLFVNIHALELLDPSLYEDSSPLAAVASRVVLEVTERASLDEVTDLTSRLARLRALGYQLAVDDLGAGYAGLTALTQIRPEYVKLDMSLVRGVEKDPLRQRILGSLTAASRELGIQVVAEGIETAAERDMMMSLGCNLLQGYLFGRPVRELARPTW